MNRSKPSMVIETRLLFLPFLLASLLLLNGCGSSTGTRPQAQTVEKAQANNVSAYVTTQLLAAGDAMADGDLNAAANILNALENQISSNDEAIALINAKAKLAIKLNEPSKAVGLLTSSSLNQHLAEASPSLVSETMTLRAQAYQADGSPLAAMRIRLQLANNILDQQTYIENHQAIWELAQAIAADDALKKQAIDSPTMSAWIELATLVQRGDIAFSQQMQELNQWQLKNPTHPAALIPVDDIVMLQMAGRTLPNKIAVLLPFEGRYQKWSNAIRDGIMHAYYQNPLRSEIIFYSADPSVSFTSLYQQAVSEGADLIIGPLLKKQLAELQDEAELPVPTIALNDSQQEFSTQNLLEFSLATEDEIDSLIDLALEQGHKRVIIISENSDWAKSANEYFTQQWEALGNQILASQVFETTRGQSPVVEKLLNIDQSHRRAREIAQLTNTRYTSEPRRRQDVDMVVVFSKPAPAQPLRPLFTYHQAGDVPMYATSNAYRGYPDRKTNRDLNGIIITDLPEVIHRPAEIPKTYSKTALLRLYAFGQDAYVLSQRATMLKNIADAEYPGATGELSISAGHVKRKLDYAKFVGGKAQPVN